MLRRFLADTRGNIAATFALMVVPIMGFAGVSVDYGRSVATRTSLQNAIDATALMLSGDVKKTTMTAAAIQTRGEQYFNAQFKGRFARDATVTATYTAATAATKGLHKIHVVATSNVDMTVSKLLVPNAVQVGSDAEIVWGLKRLEVALVLDNSGSMANDSRMTELKKATRSLLNTLHKAALQLGDVKIAVVPFTGSMNVGVSNIAATWLDWTSWDAANGTTVCTGSWPNQVCSWVPALRSTWNGCVTDRVQPTDATDTAPTSSSTRFTAIQGINGDKLECSVAPILALTDILAVGSWIDEDLNVSLPLRASVIGRAIAAMRSKGGTNGAIGTAWGWHAVTKSEPLTQALDANEETDKVIIMLTDGRNTVIRTAGNGSDPNEFGPPPCPSCDARFTQTCTNAKATGVIIYTIGVQVPGSEDVLRGCATDPSKYKKVSSASELDAVFTGIAQSLAKLRIAK